MDFVSRMIINKVEVPMVHVLIERLDQIEDALFALPKGHPVRLEIETEYSTVLGHLLENRRLQWTTNG